MATYVQFGAGWSAGEGWLNFDASPTLRLERIPLLGGLLGRLKGNPERFPDGVRYGDIVKGLPVPDGSVDGLYASHVLEHLALEDMRLALKRSLALLRPGGVFRLIVPDLASAAQAYCAALGDPEAAHRFMRATYLGREHGGCAGGSGGPMGTPTISGCMTIRRWRLNWSRPASPRSGRRAAAMRPIRCSPGWRIRSASRKTASQPWRSKPAGRKIELRHRFTH
ncbi:MAG: hypothetical protein RL339_2425 [Pseudomonadota bacterium]